MEPKEQFQKILEWIREINRNMATTSALRDLQEGLAHQMALLERKLMLRIDILEDRFDSLSEGVQALLKAIRNMRVEQYTDRTKFQREIQKIKQEIRELLH